MEHNNIDACIEEWETLSNEYRTLEKVHKEYRLKLDELTQLQQKCIKGIAHQRYRIGIIKQSLKNSKNKSFGQDLQNSRLDHTDDQDNAERNELLQTDLIRRKAQLYDMENNIPKQSGLYLKIILGNINVSILNKDDKYRYKDEYEKFKLVINLVAFAISTFNLLTNFRTVDLVHMFLLVWYYCTLTIRESILKVNGSRIKGWWRAHHFISTILSGILLIWPNGETYYAFRKQFMLFNMYISFVQYLLFMYQRGCLYRLKALGERDNMDITVEGFNSWMWRGLGFIIPFLLIGYIWELYNAYTLYLLSFTDDAEWHVFTLAIFFLILFLGNTLTTLSVIPQKIKERMKFKYRFTRLDKYIWTHKKRRVSFRNLDSPQRRTPAARAASFKRERPNVKEEDEGTGQQDKGLPLEEKHINNENENMTTEGEMNKLLDDVTKDIDFEKVDKENEDDVTDSDADDDILDSEETPNPEDKLSEESKKEK
ncbi:transmembrane protein 120 homolog isoform X1 [Macrobrachium nipponense]|uniref:transmembrane protein 120 homolog isoform X1 n=1 Tax=Macrobrachium nipponense TaxID=159736 RepID=UPI0030C7B0AE